MKKKRWLHRYKNPLALILCLGGLLLVHRNMILIGLPAFVAGILLFNNGRMPWSR